MSILSVEIILACVCEMNYRRNFSCSGSRLV
jgi:hypothetical protein